jgi:hypothetical protein
MNNIEAERIEAVKEILRRYHIGEVNFVARQIDALYQKPEISPYALPSQAVDEYFTPPEQCMISGLTCSRCGETFASYGSVPELCPQCQKEVTSQPDDDLLLSDEGWLRDILTALRFRLETENEDFHHDAVIDTQRQILNHLPLIEARERERILNYLEGLQQANPTVSLAGTIGLIKASEPKGEPK